MVVWVPLWVFYFSLKPESSAINHHLHCLISSGSLAVLTLFSPTHNALPTMCKAGRRQGHCRSLGVPPFLTAPAHVLVVSGRWFLQVVKPITWNPFKLVYGTYGLLGATHWATQPQSSVYIAGPDCVTTHLETWRSRGLISECWIVSCVGHLTVLTKGRASCQLLSQHKALQDTGDSLCFGYGHGSWVSKWKYAVL